MARSLTLKPTFCAGRQNRPWMLRVPAYLSDTGKIQRLFYGTKRECETAAGIVRTRSENYGSQANALSPTQNLIAAEACSLLRGRPDVALLELIQAGLTHEQKRQASVTWSTLVDEFLGTKQGRSPNHQRNLRYTKAHFAHLNPKKVSDITADDLSRVLDKMPQSSRNLKLSHLRSFFAYAKKRSWIDDNPADRIDFDQVVRTEVEVFTPSQVEALLVYALNNDPGLIPFLTFGFFCGIRPEGELGKLDWSCVHLTGEKAEVEIPPSVSKTKKRRFVDLSENALAWLDTYRATGGSNTGSLISYTPAVLRKHRRQAMAATGIQWIKQGMRHTFCSAWLAQNRDVNRLVLMSGHSNPDTMWRFYHRGMSEEQAAKFWAIVPEPEIGKIVAFKAN